MQNKAQNSLNYLASQMFNTSSNNPINELDIDDISYIQAYLEKIKMEKINSRKHINNNFTNNIGYRSSEATRNGKKNNQSYSIFDNNMQQTNIQDPYNYHNPYEYGNKQNIMRVNMDNNFSNDLRDINVESSLQRNTTSMVKQRGHTEKELDRFNILPYDPQDTNHIIWNDKLQNDICAPSTNRIHDNISRGHPTRNDRLDDI